MFITSSNLRNETVTDKKFKRRLWTKKFSCAAGFWLVDADNLLSSTELGTDVRIFIGQLIANPIILPNNTQTHNSWNHTLAFYHPTLLITVSSYMSTLCSLLRVSLSILRPVWLIFCLSEILEFFSGKGGHKLGICYKVTSRLRPLTTSHLNCVYRKRKGIFSVYRSIDWPYARPSVLLTS